MQEITQRNKEYPKKLLEIPNPPEKLYVEGNIELLNHDAIAIVGTRNCTKYGVSYASKFAKELSQKGITIVSGLARGIDTISHLYSMEEKGKTIAVLGSGFEHIYPEENQYLYEKIIENGGCVISEYPPKTPVDKTKFPKRNRVISGLALGVLVIEARYYSGTSVTANHAISQSKEVFCIPHPLDSTTGYLPNKLIREGAKLVTEANEILEYYHFQEKTKSIESQKVKHQNIRKRKEETLIKELQTEELNIEENISTQYQEIYNLIEKSPISINEIAKKTQNDIAKVTEALFMLELDGFITNLPGNMYIRKY